MRIWSLFLSTARWLQHNGRTSIRPPIGLPNPLSSIGTWDFVTVVCDPSGHYGRCGSGAMHHLLGVSCAFRICPIQVLGRQRGLRAGVGLVVDNERWTASGRQRSREKPPPRTVEGLQVRSQACQYGGWWPPGTVFAFPDPWDCMPGAEPTNRIDKQACVISLVVMIPRCQRGGPGSIPGWRIFGSRPERRRVRAVRGPPGPPMNISP